MGLWLFLLVSVTWVGSTLSCQRGSDCGDEECCVITSVGQVCQPFIPAGGVCHMLSGRDPSEKPDFPVMECICARGTYCVPSDPVAVLGAEGTCQRLLLS